MLKAGGGNWTHAISADGVHWYHIADALGRGPSNSTWDNQGACDGTVSFPDLGKAPFDGSTPIIMYGPDCGKPIPKPPSSAAGGVAGRAGVGDAPRVEIALPADVATDPFLTNWVKTQPGPVTFEGTPCSFPGRVWKSKVGDYWNMLCAIQSSCMCLGSLYQLRPQADDMEDGRHVVHAGQGHWQERRPCVGPSSLCACRESCLSCESGVSLREVSE